ncbi:hypothetical protein NDU88_000367 [Pleurodeles waltl]|uniref:Uncharacterized protein n=1 Tax=Pleurodeles waltl TaxID=8319 RepID=A0AAV7MPH6_PLEWA|nr:hypothetical protein NDU88_000367 [Pleurodeles waltl]
MSTDSGTGPDTGLSLADVPMLPLLNDIRTSSVLVAQWIQYASPEQVTQWSSLSPEQVAQWIQYASPEQVAQWVQCASPGALSCTCNEALRGHKLQGLTDSCYRHPGLGLAARGELGVRCSEVEFTQEVEFSIRPGAP